MKSYAVYQDIGKALEAAKSFAEAIPFRTVAIVPLETGKYMLATGYRSIVELARPAANATEQSREPVTPA